MTQTAPHRGHNIRARRDAKGLSVMELADKVQIREQSLYRIERTGKINHELARKIADALGCKLDDLEVKHEKHAKPSSRRRA